MEEFAWNEKGIEGCFRFFNRIWNYFLDNLELFQEESVKSPEMEELPPSGRRLKTKLHQTIKKVTEDIEKRYHLNTAISSIMELFNVLKKEGESLRQTEAGRTLLRQTMELLLLLLNPFAPHISEELWEKTGHQGLLANTPWPTFDPAWAMEEKVTIVVQINGKLRDKFQVPRDAEEGKVKEEALNLAKIQKYLQGKKPKKIIYIPNKLINIVI